ncbi:glycosyl transferase family 17 [Candidatus Fonsibacter ubiquis]|uniref:glycosyl transferase family 17 n=1 Tax=Candidatus Fonsibacter ubiquis TaxID=1925548 RepID=UPI000C0688CD|nr:glycosyl transferase family 17 [Candidatus Fonsibacter ubiquis]
MKIYDCITFYNENFLTNARFEILNDVVDYFIVSESKYDHSGKKKKKNFYLINQKFKNKVRYILIKDNFPNTRDPWSSESYQRERIFDGLYDALPDDLIMYSDSDEIPDPNVLKNITLNKKFGIFMMKFFSYKINIFNKYNSPWEGTKICKRKDLTSFTFLRKKIRKDNLKKPFWKFYIEKNIELFNKAGWHFNNLYTPAIISSKLKAFPHTEFSGNEFSSVKVIKKKIQTYQDLFNRNHMYNKIKINNDYPKFIINNLKKFKKYIEPY